MSLDARADIRELFNEQGQMLPPKHWSPDLRNSVESFERKEGRELQGEAAYQNDGATPILERTGKLKAPLDAGLSALERALRADLGIVDEAES